MSHSIPSRRWALLVAVLTFFAFSPAARAQYTDEQFDQWVFQQDHSAAAARKRMDSMLLTRLDDIDRTCRLNEPQKKKLQLAGRGDIKRFFDQYDRVKQKFQLVKDDNDKFQEIWQDINPLQTTLQAGLFQPDALLYKSVRNTLTPEQFSRYEAAAAERRAFRHRASIEIAVALLEQSMPLRDRQRQDLAALLAKEVPPPHKAGAHGFYFYYYTMYRLGKVPPEKLKPLFDATQWKVLNRQIDQYKGMEQFLRQQGMLEAAGGRDDQPEPPRPVRLRAVRKQ